MGRKPKLTHHSARKPWHGAMLERPWSTSPGPITSVTARSAGCRCLFSISTRGVFRRPVIVIGLVALKIARTEKGRACNRYESNLYRNTTPHCRAMLCPVLWVSPGGLLLVMRAAEPVTEGMSGKEYLEAGLRWDARPGEDGCPFEPKAVDWGLYKGRRVALDYSTPAWGNH
jgi:hypothetical protein